ncbi:MAG: glycosyltransferase family 1 protein [Cyanobacteria bacterium]|nr:glycosyltransferase family 1 protein [Cyanobacteriota bacterium]
MTIDRLVINLSYLSQRPTGHTVYAQNVIPHLRSLSPTVLIGKAVLPEWKLAHPDLDLQPTPTNLNPDYGRKGHIRRLFWTQFQLSRQARKYQASLLFSPIPEIPLWSRTPSVVTLYDFIPYRFLKPKTSLFKYYRYYIPLVLKQSKHIICISEATANDAIEFCGIEAKKMTVIPLGYDQQNFRFLDLPTQNYVLYLGRSDTYKNLDRALRAFAQVPNHQDYEFWIAGPPDPRYTPLIQGLAWDLGIKIKILDYVNYKELPVLINHAIALVFPSLWEGFGLPILEAMACGTPVITSNVSSMPEVAGDAAILVDPTNVSEIASAIASIIADTSLRNDLRSRGLQRAKQFSWATTGQQTADVLKRYLRQNLNQ